MPAEERWLQILDSAMDLFARQGYGGTTTRQIAEYADVHEAIIFRHFGCKEDLYWALLDHNCRLSKRRKQLEARLSNNDGEVFAAVASDILTRNAEDNRLFRLLVEELFAHKKYAAGKARRVSQTMADVWLKGMQAKAEVRSEKLEVRREESEARSEKREARSRDPEVRCQNARGGSTS